MNKVFKVVFNKSLGVCVAVSETAKSAKKDCKASAKSVGEVKVISVVKTFAKTALVTMMMAGAASTPMAGVLNDGGNSIVNGTDTVVAVGEENKLNSIDDVTVIGDENWVSTAVESYVFGGDNALVHLSQSLVMGYLNNVIPYFGEPSLTNANGNTIVVGGGNTSAGVFNSVFGTSNIVNGQQNTAVGATNFIEGNSNLSLSSGRSISATDFNDYIVGKYLVKALEVTADGSSAYEQTQKQAAQLTYGTEYYKEVVTRLRTYNLITQEEYDQMMSNSYYADKVQSLVSANKKIMLTAQLDARLVNSTSGKNNSLVGDASSIDGDANTLQGLYNGVKGNINTTNGAYNHTDGDNNAVMGNDNYVVGSENLVFGVQNADVYNQYQKELELNSQAYKYNQIGMSEYSQNTMDIAEKYMGKFEQNTVSGERNIAMGASLNVNGANNITMATKLENKTYETVAVEAKPLYSNYQEFRAGTTELRAAAEIWNQLSPEYLHVSEDLLAVSHRLGGVSIEEAAAMETKLAESTGKYLQDTYSETFINQMNNEIRALTSQYQSEFDKAVYEKIKAEGYSSLSAYLTAKGLTQEQFEQQYFEEEYLAKLPTSEQVLVNNEVFNPVVEGNNNIAFGAGVDVQTDNAVAIGTGAKVATANSIALGAGSFASGLTLGNEAFLVGGTATSELNISNGSEARRITGVAAGSEDTDAVNVAQLKAAIYGTGEVSGPGNSVEITGFEKDAVVTGSDNIASGTKIVTQQVSYTETTPVIPIQNKDEVFEMIIEGGVQFAMWNEVVGDDLKLTKQDLVDYVVAMENADEATLERLGNKFNAADQVFDEYIKEHPEDAERIELKSYSERYKNYGKLYELIGQGLNEIEAMEQFVDEWYAENFPPIITEEIIETVQNPIVTGNANVAFGKALNVIADNAVAIGTETNVTANNGVAIGSHASVPHESSIALGAGSSATGATLGKAAYLVGGTATSELNISNGSEARRITGVAAGAEDTDAVNIAQLKALETLAKGSSSDMEAIKNSVTMVSSSMNTVATNLQTTISSFDSYRLLNDNAVNALKTTQNVIQGTVTQNTSDIAKLGNFKAELETQITGLQDYLATIKAETTDLTTKVAENKTAIDTAKTELNAKVDANKTATDTATNELAAKVDVNKTASEQADVQLSAKVDANKTATDQANAQLAAKVDANKAASDLADQQTLTDAKTYADTILANATASSSESSAIDQAYVDQVGKDTLDQAKDFATAGDAATLKDAGEYTDAEVAKAKAYTDTEVAKANQYTDNEVAKAKSYTDIEVANSKEFATNADAVVLGQAKEFATTADAIVLSQAKEYANNADALVLGQAKEFATTADALVLGQAKEHATNADAVVLAQAKDFATVADSIVLNQAKDHANAGDKATLAESKSYADKVGETTLSQAKAADEVVLVNANKHTDEAVAKAEAKAEAGDKETLAQAKAHADQVGADGKVYADAGDKATLEAANKYTDSRFDKFLTTEDVGTYVGAAVAETKQYSEIQSQKVLDEAKAYTDNRITNLEQTFREENTQLRAGIAGTLAVAGLPQPTEAGYSMVSMATSAYQGESAIAVGLSAITDNNRYVFKFGGTVDSQNNVSGVAAVGFQWK